MLLSKYLAAAAACCAMRTGIWCSLRRLMMTPIHIAVARQKHEYCTLPLRGGKMWCSGWGIRMLLNVELRGHRCRRNTSYLASNMQHSHLIDQRRGAVHESGLPCLQVGLLDVDICGPSVPRMLGLEGQDIHQSASVRPIVLS